MYAPVKSLKVAIFGYWYSIVLKTENVKYSRWKINFISTDGPEKCADMPLPIVARLDGWLVGWFFRSVNTETANWQIEAVKGGSGLLHEYTQPFHSALLTRDFETLLMSRNFCKGIFLILKHLFEIVQTTCITYSVHLVTIFQAQQPCSTVGDMPATAPARFVSKWRLKYLKMWPHSLSLSVCVAHTHLPNALQWNRLGGSGGRFGAYDLQRGCPRARRRDSRNLLLRNMDFRVREMH